MRVAGAVLLVVSGVSLVAQTTGFTLREYNAPQFTAPANAPSRGVIAGTDEPGPRLVVTGRTLEGTRPVAGVSLFVFHTDVEGLYAPNVSTQYGELHPRLHVALRTDADGRYQFDTIRPGSYGSPAGPSHVHFVVQARGYQPLLIALQFDDDPVVQQLRKAGKPLLDPDAFRNGPCKSRPDCVLTRPVTRDGQGVAHVTRDIQMVKR